MDIPQPKLDQALRMVQRGEMQPDEAAHWLLQNSTHYHPPVRSATPDSMSVAELMRDLGSPPLDIQRDWDQQVARLGQSFLRTFGVPLCELSASDLRIDADNRLSFTPSFIERFAANNQSNQIEITRQTAPALSPSRRGKSQQASDRKSDDGSRVSGVSKSSSFFARRRWLVSTIIYGAAFGLLGLTFYLLLPKASSEIATDTTRERASLQSSAKLSSVFSPTTEPSFRNSATESETLDSEPDNVPLETIEVPAEPAKQEEQSRATMGLDSFAGGNWGNASELLPEATFNASLIEPSDDDDSSSDEMSSADSPEVPLSIIVDLPTAVEGDTAASMADDAPDSPTSVAHGNTSIVLPPIPSRAMAEQGIESVVLAERKPKSLAITFPVDSGLTVEVEDQQWLFKDKKDQTVVGLFVPGETDLRFRWTDNAISRPVAKQLASGSMQTSADDGLTTKIYLRPVVNAPAWPIDITTGDAKAAWPIGVSPPLGPSKLSIGFELPKTILQSWIQPYDPNKIRRCQSIAEFTLDADPTIAVRSRIDVRVGTRITLRVRHAAQLDKEFPWQMISSNRVQSAASQIGTQLARAANEQKELKSLSYKAGASEKRVITARREMIDQAVVKLQSLSKRLTQYESLLTQLQRDSYLNLRLAVDWSESADVASQTIFEMTPQVEMKPESSDPAK